MLRIHSSRKSINFFFIVSVEGCCKKLQVTGTDNQDEFYQEMMGEYTIYQNYSHLDFTENPYVKHDLAKGVFPVYVHHMFVNEENPKRAFLYFYYNTEPKKTEKECPQGCWMIGKKDFLIKFLNKQSICAWQIQLRSSFIILMKLHKNSISAHLSMLMHFLAFTRTDLFLLPPLR